MEGLIFNFIFVGTKGFFEVENMEFEHFQFDLSKLSYQKIPFVGNKKNKKKIFSQLPLSHHDFGPS